VSWGSAPPVFPPLQERSRATLEALLRAAESLLLEHSFADLSVTRIVHEAGSSSGSFYARFRDKTALLHALHQRFVERGIALARTRVSALGSKTPSMAELASVVVDSLVRIFSAERGVIRAVLVESLKDEAFAERARDFVTTVSELAASRTDRSDRSAARAAAAIRVGVLTVMAVLEQDLFFGSALSTIHGPSGSVSKGDRDRLRRLFLAAVAMD
jgi:AcrR family transcriptional regulator